MTRKLLLISLLLVLAILGIGVSGSYDILEEPAEALEIHPPREDTEPFELLHEQVILKPVKHLHGPDSAKFIDISDDGRAAIAESEKEMPREEKVFLGYFYVTGYDICPSCCGKTDGVTASGVVAEIGRTCAANGMAFGTRLWIDGIGERVVEDRGGMGLGHIDILCGNHTECYAVTGWYAVYLMKGKEV